MKPRTRIRLGLRAALRRRYSYAALRVLRRSARAAFDAHQRRSVGPEPYDGETEWRAISAGYWQALQRLRRRWPQLDLCDPRAEP